MLKGGTKIVGAAPLAHVEIDLHLRLEAPVAALVDVEPARRIVLANQNSINLVLNSLFVFVVPELRFAEHLKFR